MCSPSLESSGPPAQASAGPAEAAAPSSKDAPPAVKGASPRTPGAAAAESAKAFDALEQHFVAAGGRGKQPCTKSRINRIGSKQTLKSLRPTLNEP